MQASDAPIPVLPNAPQYKGVASTSTTAGPATSQRASERARRSNPNPPSSMPRQMEAAQIERQDELGNRIHRELTHRQRHQQMSETRFGPDFFRHLFERQRL